jgi:hypothetical protein
VTWLRRHALVISIAILGVISFAVFTWAEYGYFCDQGRDHGDQGCQSFWGKAHLHDWIYNAASNYQSELLFGILVLILLKKISSVQDKERDEA